MGAFLIFFFLPPIYFSNFFYFSPGGSLVVKIFTVVLKKTRHYYHSLLLCNAQRSTPRYQAVKVHTMLKISLHCMKWLLFCEMLVLILLFRIFSFEKVADVLVKTYWITISLNHHLKKIFIYINKRIPKRITKHSGENKMGPEKGSVASCVCYTPSLIKLSGFYQFVGFLANVLSDFRLKLLDFRLPWSDIEDTEVSWVISHKGIFFNVKKN